MKKTKRTIDYIAAAMIGIGSFAAPEALAALSVTTTSSAATLAGAILGGGITLNSASYAGDSSASGTFTGGSTVPLGFESGILLTTGMASTAGTGVNTSSGATTSHATAGDAALTTQAGYPTHDAAILSMNFTISPTDVGNIFFNFVFASEEYNEYAPSEYNDVFRLELDGSNIAMLPGGAGVVSINNVNLGSNSAYYINNSPGIHAIEYDGLTTVLTASAIGLAPGAHTLRFAIADTSDSVLDSAVFIQGGSFSTTMTPVPEPSTILAGALLAIPFGIRSYRQFRSRNTIVS